MMESAYREGERLQKVQNVLRKLADLHEAGTVPPELSKITSKAATEELLSSDFRSPGVHKVHLKDVLKETATKARGITSERSYVGRIMPTGEDHWVSFSNVNLEAIGKVAAKGTTYAFQQVKEGITRANRLKAAGIETKAKW